MPAALAEGGGVAAVIIFGEPGQVDLGCCASHGKSFSHSIYSFLSTIFC